MEIKYYFNFSKQSLHISLNPDFLPDDDWKEIDKDTHSTYLNAINSGRIVLGDNEFSDPKPTGYHVWEDGNWVNHRTSDEIKASEMKSLRPLTRRQFRLALAMSGYDLKEIETLIDQIEDPMQRTIAQIEWQDATDFERTNPTLLMMAQLLGLSSEDVNSLWEYGLTL